MSIPRPPFVGWLARGEAVCLIFICPKQWWLGQNCPPEMIGDTFVWPKTILSLRLQHICLLVPFLFAFIMLHSRFTLHKQAYSKRNWSFRLVYPVQVETCLNIGWLVDDIWKMRPLWTGSIIVKMYWPLNAVSIFGKEHGAHDGCNGGRRYKSLQIFRPLKRSTSDWLCAVATCI